MPTSTPGPGPGPTLLPLSSPSPAFSHPSPLPKRTFERTQSQQLATALDVDLSLPTAVAHLVSHLLHPLSSHYPSHTLQALRHDLSGRLEDLFRDTWDENHPQHGSGYRSLICTNAHHLPQLLRESAKRVSVDISLWKSVLSAGRGRKDDEEWEAWCDPGQVVWRYGGWEWEDVGFEPLKVVRGPFQIIWQGGAEPTQPTNTPLQGISTTPARPSHAIPIRAPTVFAIPPTPAAPASHLTFPPSPLDGLSHKSETLAEANTSRPLSPVFSSANDNIVSSTFNMQSELGLGPAPFFQRSTSPSFSDGSNISLSSAFSQREPQPRGVSDSSIDSVNSDSHAHTQSYRAAQRVSHRGSESLSSVSSSASASESESNSGHTQLLTPASRPGSVDPFGNGASIPHLSIKEHRSSDLDKDRERDLRMRKITPPMLALHRGRTPSPHPSTPEQSSTTPATESTITPHSVLPASPSVTPYDGGNVTVLGGGVKLGGGGTSSRSVSAMSHRSTSGGNGIDRSRSPSVSLASRALSTALQPENGEMPTGTRKQRTRRRIMPTYLGHLGQPGVGGPINGVFGQFAAHPLHPTPTPQGNGNYVQHVGVGVAPPPISVQGVRSLSGSSQRM